MPPLRGYDRIVSKQKSASLWFFLAEISISQPRIPLAPTGASTSQAVFTMIPPECCGRSFLKTSVVLAGTTPLIDGLLEAQSGNAARPLVGYVVSFISPLRD